MAAPEGIAPDRRRLVDDLGRHCAAEMQELLQRHVNVAAIALEADELATMLVMIANGVSTGALHFMLANARPDVDLDAFYRDMAHRLHQLALTTQPLVLARLAEQAA